MSIADICSKAYRGLQHLPPASYRPLCLTLIPVITQLAYRRFRHNIYPDLTHSALKRKLEQRDVQHKYFTITAMLQAGIFAFFARTNPYYWIPFGYTLTHFIWTDFTKRQEPDPKDGNLFHSMDGLKPIHGTDTPKRQHLEPKNETPHSIRKLHGTDVTKKQDLEPKTGTPIHRVKPMHGTDATKRQDDGTPYKLKPVGK